MKLDSQQTKIINSSEKNIIVVAGAGSGKTTVLTERIRHLINDLHVKPADITAITFTNMAADEMKERLSDIEGIEDAFIGTIHSFANKIMLASGVYYRLLTDEIHFALCAELISKYCKHLTVDKYTTFHEMASQVKFGKYTKKEVEDFLSDEEMAEYKFLYSETPAADFPETVPSLCKARNIITFDTLLRYANTYFTKHNISIKYCFVDEFQDVGNLENRFIESLNAENYFLVGDDWQSIYKFKGANVEIFKSRIKNPYWTTYYMTNNYRNARKIIETANTVIDSVKDRLPKNIIPVNQNRGTVIVKDKSMLSDYLDIIKMSEGFGQWFFLARLNADCVKLLNECKKKGIPATMFKQGDLTLQELREQMAGDCVKILTVHSAKGLENENVLLYGNFPVTVKNPSNRHFKSKYEKKVNPEERRIMYVGVTRARNSLLILN